MASSIFFEESSQPQIYMQSIAILERAVRFLKAVVGGGKTILKALEPIPKVRIYLGLLDILNYSPQLLSTAIVSLEESPCIFELCWTCGKLQDKEVPPKSIPYIHVAHPQQFFIHISNHVGPGNCPWALKEATLLAVVIAGGPSAVTKRGAN